MSQRHHPGPHPTDQNTFGFSAMDTMQANQQLEQQDSEDVMMLLDNSMFSPFDPNTLSLSMADSADMPPPTHLDGLHLSSTSAAATTIVAPPSLARARAPVSASALAPTTTPTSSMPPSTSTAGGAQFDDESSRNKFQPPSSRNNSSSLVGLPPPPLPMAPPPTIPGSTLTGFTKKRDWAAKTVAELADLQQILDANGRIKYLSPNVTALTGYSRDEIMGQFLRDLIHPDDNHVFVAELNEAIATGGTMRVFYRLRKKDGSYGVFESIGHGHIAAAQHAPNPNNQSQFCQAVFLMSRPYPTENASLLDSFLEHKIESERLRRRIAELRREEDEDDEAQAQWGAKGASQSGGPRSDIAGPEDTPMSAAPGDRSMLPPPDRRPASQANAALTRENLEGIVAGNTQDSISDKMARYEGLTSHAETIELLTGLRYHEGERSRGNNSPLLVKGDVGIAMPLDRDRESRGCSDKKKKIKMADEYVCTDCGTLESPEWRKGPNGPKTLCNACGLRWAKREKKKTSKASKAASGGNPDPSPA